MGFNIGDRVICTTRVDGFYDTAGKLGTVVSLLSPHLCGVEFDEDIGEHDCNGCGTYGHCLWVNYEDLTKMEFNIGDKVVCVMAVYGHPCTLNKYGRVVCYTQRYYGGEFEENVYGHNCNGLGKQGHCLWVTPRSLYLAQLINTKSASEREFITLQGNEVA